MPAISFLICCLLSASALAVENFSSTLKKTEKATCDSEVRESVEAIGLTINDIELVRNDNVNCAQDGFSIEVRTKKEFTFKYRLIPANAVLTITDYVLLKYTTIDETVISTQPKYKTVNIAQKVDMSNINCCGDPDHLPGKCKTQSRQTTVFGSYPGLTDKIKNFEFVCKNGKLNGLYTEWDSKGESRKTTGSFSAGIPEGSWIVKDLNSSNFYKLQYENNRLTKIVIPLAGKMKSEEYLVQDNVPSDLIDERQIGVFFPKQVDPYFDLAWHQGTIGFDHILFFSNPKKENVVGIAVAQYRFNARHICTNWSCDHENSTDDHIWEVFEHKNGMCRTKYAARNLMEWPHLVPKKFYDLWFECPKFTSLIDYYDGGMLGVSLSTPVFDRPGGKRLEIKLDSSEESEPVVTIIEKKVYKGELWIKVNARQGVCSGEEKELGNFWLPFYNGNSVNLERYGRGC